MKIKSLSNKLEQLPNRLSNMYDTPDKLFYVGQEIDDELPHVAIIGSRRPSQYGLEMAERLASSLAASGVVVVSGLAIGIDGAAHKAALSAEGKTIAVLPAGLDTIYPVSHQALADEIIDSNSTLISEYPTKTTVRKHQFIARNRIIAGLSDAVVVVEATDRSGSLTTANFALELGRPVMAVPGEATSALSAGTNNLIRLGAEIVTKPEDVINNLGLEVYVSEFKPVAESASEARILELLNRGIMESSELQQQASMNSEEYNRTISMMEIKGQIKNMGAGRYILT